MSKNVKIKILLLYILLLLYKKMVVSSLGFPIVNYRCVWLLCVLVTTGWFCQKPPCGSWHLCLWGAREASRSPFIVSMQCAVIFHFPNCRDSHIILWRKYSKQFFFPIDTHTHFFFFRKRKIKHWAPQFTEHFFSVLCGLRCERNNGQCLLQGFVRRTNTDLLRCCFAAHCSWLRNLLLLLHCQCKRPWIECLKRSGSGQEFSAHSNAQCEGQLEK